MEKKVKKVRKCFLSFVTQHVICSVRSDPFLTLVLNIMHTSGESVKKDQRNTREGPAKVDQESPQFFTIEGRIEEGMHKDPHRPGLKPNQR